MMMIHSFEKKNALVNGMLLWLY